MQQIILFLVRNKNFLFFLFLFALSVLLTFQAHNYHRSKFIHSANFLSGGIYNIRSQITSYLDLKHENQSLVEENENLRAQIEFLKRRVVQEEKRVLPDSQYRVRNARIINNSFSKTKNKLTLNKGSRDGIDIDMGVIAPGGIVGIVDRVSANYATVMSILNTRSRINVKLKNSNHFGTLIWNTSDPRLVQLIDVPIQASPKIGDTVITGGRSTIFPEGIPVGVIGEFKPDKEGNYYDLDIRLFNDMTSIEHVYIIENLYQHEIRTLEMDPEYVEE